MIYNIVKCFLFIIAPGVLQSQNTVKSAVYNIETNLPVINVSIKVEDSDKGVYSDIKGEFLLEDIADSSILVFEKIGFKTIKLSFQSIVEIIYITPEVSSLDEVVIRSFSSSQLKQIAPDNLTLSQNDIQKLPFILGEKDVLKLIQFTPGVQQAAEGQTGMLVRGGNGSMNLTLLDNIYLHNTAHLGGLFSAVNSDFVHSLEFYKSGFDATYGGRLSSVTSIQTLKNTDSTEFNGSIGLLSAKLTGNIKLNKINSLLLSGRRTYLEFFKPFAGKSNSILGKKKNYFLYDGLAKYTSRISNSSKLEIQSYFTRDNFTDQTKGRNRRLEWGNILLGTTFTHQFSEILNSQTTISNSNYNFSFSDSDFPFDYSAESNFNVFSVNHSFLWVTAKNLLKLGGTFNKNQTLPKRVKATVDMVPLEISNQDKFNYSELSLFGDAEFSPLNKIEVKTGLRFTTFFTKENTVIEEDVFYVIEPRLSVKYNIKETQAFKVSYQRLSQFIHQASTSGLSLPADFFVVSTKNIKPQISNQLSFGYVFEQGNLQLNSAVYFKNVANYTEFKNGAVNNLFSGNVYDDIIVGEFNSFGLELSLNKKWNNVTAQAALTLSNTIAKFDEINNGNYFRTTFDRPVNVNSILQYELTNRITLGALFLFTSGQNYTRPSDIRIVSESPVINFESKNASRYPNYHRLDVSCTYAFKTKGSWKSKLNLTIYNVYNRTNPFQITFQTEGSSSDSGIEIKENKESLFPILPTLNWIFSF